MFYNLTTRDKHGYPIPQYNLGDTGLGKWSGNDSFTKMLLHFEGTDGDNTIVDSAMAGGFAMTANGNAVLTNTNKKFGATSLTLDGSGDYISVGDDDAFTIGTDPFTDEIWINPAANNGLRSIIERRPSDSYGTGFCLRFNGGPLTIATGTSTVINSSITPALNVWSHIAVIGDGAANGLRKIILYVNGVVAGTWTYDYNFSSTRLRLGTYWGSSGDFYQGLMDEYRMSMGIARWTEPFTPPTRAYL